jgi:hypothetical protein
MDIGSLPVGRAVANRLVGIVVGVVAGACEYGWSQADSVNRINTISAAKLL